MTQQFSVTLYRSVRDRRGRRERWTWTDLSERLRQPLRGQAKDRLPLWSPVSFYEGASRGAAGVAWVHLLVWDYDDGTPIDMAVAPWMAWPWLVYTTWGHTPEHPKFRLVLPLAHPIRGRDWKARAWPAAVELAAGEPDPKCKDPSRMYFLPGAPPQRIDAFRFIEHDPGGRLLALELKAVERKVRPPRRVIRLPGPAADRLRSRRLRSDPTTREAAAQELGARISGDRATRILCPSCQRLDVYFFIQPEKQVRAYCNHRNSCGWAGHLDELLGLRG